MNDTQSLNEAQVLVSMTFKDKFNRTMVMFKNHGLAIFFTHFLLVFFSTVMLVGLIAVLASPDQLDIFLANDKDAATWSMVGIYLLIFIGYFFFPTFLAIGLYSLILAYAQGEEPDSIVNVVFKPFTRIRTYIAPVAAMIILLLLYWCVAFVAWYLLNHIPILNEILDLGSNIFWFPFFSCYLIYLADEKNITIYRAITSTFDLIFSDFHSWSLIFFLLLIGTAAENILFKGMFGVENLPSPMNYLWVILYNLFFFSFMGCFIVLSYRQSRARLFLKRQV